MTWEYNYIVVIYLLSWDSSCSSGVILQLDFFVLRICRLFVRVCCTFAPAIAITNAFLYPTLVFRPMLVRQGRHQAAFLIYVAVSTYVRSLP